MFSIHYNADYNTRLKEIFKRIEESEDIVTIENAASIRKRMKHIPDQEIIAYIGMADMPGIIYILCLKYGQKPQLIPIPDDVMIRVGECNAANMSYLAVYLHFLRFEGGMLTLEGNVSYPAVLGACGFGVRVNGHMMDAVMTDMHLDLKMGATVYEKRTAFTFSTELSEDADIVFLNKINGFEAEYGRINAMRFSPVADHIPGQYFWKDGWIFYIDGRKLICRKADADLVKKKELVFREALKEYAPSKWEWACKLRDYYYKNRKKRKQIWLFMDRPEAADDNAKVLFRYMQKKQDIDSWFILSRDSGEYAGMAETGNVAEIYSEQHYKLHLLADYIVSSQCNGVVENPFWEDGEFFRDLYHRPGIIFLQHGVIKDDMSGTLNRYNTNFTGFVTSTEAEWRSILDYPYFYTEKEVWLTGLPRFDELTDRKEKIILIMPSWRQGLMEQVWNEEKHNMQWVLKPGFEKSDYFKSYKSLLENEKLGEMCEHYGYKLVFMAHPLMKPCAGMLAADAVCEIWDESVSYKEAFGRGALLVTDYSSVAFDFLYLHKPVIYYQFDREAFFREHTYRPGYFKYENEDLGYICEDEEALVRKICGYMETDCQVSEEHKVKIEALWPYREGFCERVYNKIREAR